MGDTNRIFGDVGFDSGSQPQVQVDSNKNLQFDDIEKNDVKIAHKVSLNKSSGRSSIEDMQVGERELSEVVRKHSFILNIFYNEN